MTPAHSTQAYTKIHSQYYQNTAFKDFRAPEFGDYDVLVAVLPIAHRRGAGARSAGRH